MPGGMIGTGTGFFRSLDKNGEPHVPAIVTNKHVVAGAIKGRFLTGTTRCRWGDQRWEPIKRLSLITSNDDGRPTQIRTSIFVQCLSPLT